MFRLEPRELIGVLSMPGTNAGSPGTIRPEPVFKKSFWFRRFIGY
jgi:hypothetical protein